MLDAKVSTELFPATDLVRLRGGGESADAPVRLQWTYRLRQGIRIDVILAYSVLDKRRVYKISRYIRQPHRKELI